MSKIEVDAIDKQSGSTLTLGGSGTAVTLACGATQSGFGRTGTVDWQTGSIKTATFTATSGEGYFCNTTAGSFEVDLPAGSAGAIVSVQDYANTFDSNALTVDPNGSEKINGGGAGETLTLQTEGQGITLVYIDSTVGWRSVQDNDFATQGGSFLIATGGTITCCGDFKIHTFTGPGTFAVSGISSVAANNQMDYLVVAGGGGGSGIFGNSHGAGGGAGGFRSSNDTCMSAPLTSPLANPTGLTATVASFPITVGAGGAGVPVSGPSTRIPGNISTFSTITSAGGGGGGSAQSCAVKPGEAGGSGGGGGGPGGSGGAGNTPPVSPPQGTNGGSPSHSSPGYGTGGGGGAGGVGNDGSPTAGGVGGVGSFMVSAGFAGCNGTPGPVSGTRYFSGGGSGSTYQGGTIPGPPAGGGGEGKTTPVGDTAPVQGVVNSGGGGGSVSESSGSTGGSGGTGGSGIVIIRYKFQ
jgi:hypothetical protein